MSAMIWLVILIVLVLIEAATAGLTTIWFAGGALVAAIVSYFGAGIVPQLLVFSAVSILLLIFTRPLAVKSLKTHEVKTNVDDLPGKRAVVTKDINNLAQEGQVLLNDVDWMARAESDKILIPAGAVVEIVAVKGVKLIVREVKEEA